MIMNFDEELWKLRHKLIPAVFHFQKLNSMHQINDSASQSTNQVLNYQCQICLFGCNKKMKDQNLDCVHTMPAHFENDEKCDGSKI